MGQLVVGKGKETGDIRIIGVELKFRNPMGGGEELLMFSTNIVVPQSERGYPNAPLHFPITIHTSRGDINGFLEGYLY